MAAKTKIKKIKVAKRTTEPDGSVKVWYRIADLTLDENNARIHEDRDLDAIATSILEFGQQKPVVIDGDGIVRAGNGTCAALLARGETFVWGIQSELRGAKAIAYALADNRTAELSRWDFQLVAESMKWLQDQGEDLLKLGWAQHEIEPLLQAEWKPPAPTDEDFAAGQNGHGDEDHVAIKVSRAQNETIVRAIAAYREASGDAGCDVGAALEAICAAYLGEE